MRYSSATQKARKKFLRQKTLSEKEAEIIEKDFQGKDYTHYEFINENEFFQPEWYSADATYRKISQSIQPGVSLRLVMKYAAAIVLLIAISFGVYQYNKPAENRIVSTSYGEKKQIALPDGSVVILNSLSSISYPENMRNGRTREIELCGEAYFDVVKDEQRAFVVKASEIEIIVLGTKFNTSAYDNDENIITDLYEGAVFLNFGVGNDLRLKPGEKAVYNKLSDKVAISAVVDKNNSAWISGRLYFENVALKNIFKILEREKNITFLISDEIDKELKLTAKFNNNESVEEMLEHLSLPGGFTFEKKENVYIIKKQKH